ncbi:MAG: hypothetical protein WC881_02095 [Elusimicrobiota bacterium]|jgi:hypothetical protein
MFGINLSRWASAVLAVGLALPAAAQKGMDQDAGFGSAVAAVQAAVSKDAAAGLAKAFGARLRTHAALANIDLRACEAAAAESLNFTPTRFQADDGSPLIGFGAAGYAESSPMSVSLVLLTDAAVYYYYESCDICADLIMCDLKTRAVQSLISAHAIDCRDTAPYAKGNVVYDACAPR